MREACDVAVFTSFSLPRQSWHVVEFLPGLRNGQTSSMPNEEPRMLRWLVDPHSDTHRVSEATRRRAPSGPSVVRLTLNPIAGDGDPVVIHAALISRLAPPVAS